MSTAPAPRPAAPSVDAPRWAGGRVLLRLDGLFEALLCVFLVLRPVLGLDTRVPLPRPVGTSLTVGFGLLLLPLLPLLWLASRAPRR